MSARTRLAATFSLACVVLLLVAPSVARAQTSTTTTLPPTPIAIELVSQDSFVRTGQDFHINLKITGATDTDVVRYAVYQAARNRADYRTLIDSGGVPDVTLVAHSEPYKSVFDPTQQVVTLTIPVGVATRTPGVYPIGISVAPPATSGSSPSPRASRTLLTTLIRVTDVDTTGGPLSVAMVLPLRSPPARQPDQSLQMPASDRARLDGLATTFSDDFPAFPLTLAPNPETLDALDGGTPDDRGVLNHLKSVTAGREIVGSTYVPVDDEAWRADGLSTQLGEQLNTGFTTINRALAAASSQVTTDLALTAPSDTPATLEWRRALGISHLVIPEDNLVPLDRDAFPSTVLRTFVVNDAAGNEVRAAAADSRLSDLAGQLSRTTSTSNRALLAQQFLADLVSAYFDNPRLTRGVVVVLPADWTVNATIHDVLLPALQSIGVLSPVTLSRFFATVGPSSPFRASSSLAANAAPLRRTLRPTPAEGLGDYGLRLDRVTRRLADFTAIIDDPNGKAKADELTDLIAVSGDSRLTVAQRQAYLDAVDQTVTRQLHAADGGEGIVGPRSQRITMTSGSATIPLDLQNNLAFGVRVRIELHSDKLAFPNGDVQSAKLTPGANHIVFAVRAKTSGDSLLEIDVLPDTGDSGLGAFARVRFTVRSTALSGVGFGLSILALIVLFVWWFRHARRTRRNAKHSKRWTVTPAGGEPAATAGDPTRLVPVDTTIDRPPQRTEP